MTNLILLNNLLKRYKLFTMKLINASTNIENNILQKGSGRNIEERIISIVIATIIMFTITSILSFIGFLTNEFLISMVFFLIGIFLSKYINKNIFGFERKEKDLKEEEIYLINLLKNINDTHISIRDKINNGVILVNFTDYSVLLKEFNLAVVTLEKYNSKHLALKYRLNHKIVSSSYKNQINIFKEIYASKRTAK